MTTAVPEDAMPTPSAALTDSAALLLSLHNAGAPQFDPVRWHYIQALQQRTMLHQGRARAILDTKLQQVLAALHLRLEKARIEKNNLEQAQRETEIALFHTAQQRPQIDSLSALLRQLQQHEPSNKSENLSADITPLNARPELKTIQHFRNTWAKLSVDKQVAQALEQAPKNAGPINSHMLVLRSLTLMRDIAPDYLGRFMSYADTLLCLEQSEKEKSALPKRAATAKPTKRTRKP